MKKFSLIIALFFLFPASSAHAGISQPPTTRGLVGYWSMEDCKLTKATDNSGKGSTGTLTNFALTGATSNWVTGKRGSCALNFDGANDYVNLGNPTTLNVVSNYTISMWVKPVTFTNYQNLIGKIGATAQYGIIVPSTGIWRAQDSSTIDITGAQLRLNEWSHVVVSYDGGTIRTYNDGVFMSSGARTNVQQGSSVTIGADTVNSRYFNGSIDEVRIYSRALTGNEIASLYTAGVAKMNTSTAKLQTGTSLVSGLVGHWTFDGKYLTSTKAKDTSGNSNVGTLNGANGKPIPKPGKLGQALTFDGTDDYVSTGLNIDAEPVSVALWINPISIAAAHCFWCTDNGAWDKGVEITAGTFQVHAGASLVDTSVAATANVWQHVVATYTSADIVLYVNGVRVWNRGVAPGADSGSGLELGRANYLAGAGSRFFNGSIDDVRVYNRALSTSEITALYKLGR